MFFARILILIFCLAGSIQAQQIRVVSAEDGLPIPATHIKCFLPEHKQNQLFVSNDKGWVDIGSFVQNRFPVIVQISFLGFERIQDTLLSNKEVVFKLKSVSAILNEVVVTAQYAPNSSEKAVHKIRVIDNKKIEKMAAQNLRDVLTNELNVRISQDNILGSSMSIQGISGQNIKILIDGVPVTGRLNGNIDLSQINMNNVERIELVEGPLSVNFGTDALGGTINIITKKSQQHYASVGVNTYYESIGTYNTDLRVGLQQKNNTFVFTAGRYFFDGWSASDSPFKIQQKILPDTSRFQAWKPKKQHFGGFSWNRYLNNKLKANYTVDYYQESIVNRGVPRRPYFNTAFDDTYYTQRINNAVSFTGPLNSKYYLNAMVAHNYYKRQKNTYFKNLETLNEQLTENNSDHDTSIFTNFMSRSSVSTTFDTARFNMELGYDINYETGLGVRIKDLKQSIGDFALFSTAEYKPIKNFTVKPGLRLIHNTAYRAPLVPSLNIKYALGDAKYKNTWTFRLSYAHGFRAPSLKELYFFFVDINHNITGNENLKAENSHNFNASANFSRQYKAYVLKTELSAFYNHIENMISLAQGVGTNFSYFNIDVFQSLGTQVNFEWAWSHIKANVGAAWIGRYNQLNEVNNSERFLYSPELRTNLIHDWHKTKSSVAVFYKFTGRMPLYRYGEGGDIQFSEIQEFHMTDITFSKRFWVDKITFAFGVKNLLNVQNINGVVSGGAHSAGGNSMPIAMGRLYFVKLNLNLHSKN
jgi:outer membrane receptor for ferrienterochelin and colicins